MNAGQSRNSAVRKGCAFAATAALMAIAGCTGPDEGSGFDLDRSEVVMVAFDGAALRWEVWASEVDGDSLRTLQLPTDPGFPESRWLEPQWSPDGESIMFRASSTGTDDWYYLLFDRHGRNRRVITPVGGYAEGAAWSPDGTRILYQAGFVGEIVETRIADVATGRSSPLKLVDGAVGGDSIYLDQRTEAVCLGSDGDGCGLYDAAFSGEDELYVIGAVGKRWTDPTLVGTDLELFAVDLATGRPTRRITDNDLNETGFQLSPDARYAIVSRLFLNEFLVWALDLQTGEQIRIGEPSSAFRSSRMRWSNDSRRIVWAEDPIVAWFDVREPLVDHPVAELAGVSEADLYLRD